jgi:Ca2+-binding RTX toxin-like protein
LNSSGAQTLTTIDTLAGGEGTDTLLAAISGTSTYSPALTGIEKLVTTFTGLGTLSLANATGVTSIEASGSTQTAKITNIASASGVTLDVNGTAQSATFAFTTAAVVGTADAVTLKVADVTAGTITVAGIETINIVSNGDSNVLTALSATSAEQINASGAGNLNLGTLSDYNTSLNASALTGKLTVTASAESSSIVGGSGNDTIVGGAGNDTLTGNAGNDRLTAGAGDDYLSDTAGTNTFTFVGNFTTADTVVGGTGTDTLSLDTGSVSGLGSTTKLTNVSNIEKITLTTTALTGTANTSYVQAGITGVTLSVGSNGGTVTFEAGTKTLTLGATENAGALTVNDTGVATNDSLTISAASETDSFSGEAVTINGFESVTLAAGDTPQTVSTITVNGDAAASGANTPATLTITGDDTSGLTTSGAITLGAATGTGTINASGLAGALVMGAAAVGVTSIVGGSAGDTLLGTSGNAVLTSTISGGAGNDNITGGTYNDSIDGGDGADTVVGSTGNDNITLGAGADVFQTTQANFAALTTIDGGDGTDKLYLSNITAVTDSAFANKTSLETVTSGTAGLAVTLGTYAAATGVATVTFAGTSGSITDTVTAGSTFTNNLTVNFDASVSGDSNKVIGTGYTKILTVNATSATAFDTGTASITGGSGTADTLNLVAGTYSSTNLQYVTAIENINVTNPSAGAADASLTLSANNLVSGATLTVSGAAIVDSSKDLTVNGTNITAGQLIVVGSTGADTITGSASSTAGDSLSGGAGNDTFSFAYGNLSSSDTVVGGEGVADVLQITGAGTVTDTAFTSISGVENLTYSAAETITFGAYAAAAGITKIVDTSDALSLTLGAAYTNNLTVALNSGNDTVTGTLYTGNLTVTVEAANLDSSDTLTAGDGTSDTLTVTYAGSGLTLPSTVTGFETFKSATNDASGTLALNNANVAAAKAATVDFSANTSTAVGFDASAELDGSITYIGGGGVDTVSITGSSLGDSINLGAGDDSLVVTSDTYLTSNDTIAGGDGTDTMTLSGSGGTLADVAFTNVTSFNYLTFSGATTHTVVAGAAFQTAGFTSINGSTGGDSITIGSGVTRNLTIDTKINATTNDDLINASGYTGSLTVKATASTTVAAVDADDTITGGSGSDTLTLYLIDADIAVGSTVTGSGGTTDTITSANLANITKFEIIKTGTDDIAIITLNDANAVSGSIKVDTSANATTTVTLNAANEDDSTLWYVGGNGASTVMGTIKADTITGGSGADSLNGGAGNDSISGGSGNDTIWGSTGVDTITGGAGNDTFQINSTGFETGTLSPAVVYYGGVVASGASVSTAGFDKITDFGAGDALYVGGQVASTTAGTNGVDLTWTDQAGLLRGTYSATDNTFTFSTTGTDSIYAYDFDGSSTTNDIRAVVLVGYVDSGAADTLTTGLVGTA